MRTDHLVILAGGKATRLGPLTATMNKALVTVGQQPMIIQQILGMNIEHVIVVVSPDSRSQIEAMCARALPDRFKVEVVVQEHAYGPVNAIALGTLPLGPGRTCVLMADSLYDWDEARSMCEYIENCIGVYRTTNTSRSWCWSPGGMGTWRDGVPDVNAPTVFTGILVGETDRIYNAAVIFGHIDVGMAAMLNLLEPCSIYPFQEWTDTGDIKALASAKRKMFRSRDNHKLFLDERGVITKQGCDTAQVNALTMVPLAASHLFPRVFMAGDDYVCMEYVDLPSLAELFLYWPGTPDMWVHILDNVLAGMVSLWTSSQHRPTTVSARECARNALITKPRGRIIDAGLELPDWWRDLELLLLEEVIEDSKYRQVRLHGDLNFCNILYSLSTGTFKLLDPRGTLGGSIIGDRIYELAKLRYSWHGFAAINHGIFGKQHRPDLVEALDARIAEEHRLEHVAAVEATLFLSAVPLHPPHQRPWLLNAAELRAREALA